MTLEQISIDDLLGTLDYSAKSTADKFIQSDSDALKDNKINCITLSETNEEEQIEVLEVKETYEVHFYNTDGKQIMDWFESEDRSGAESAARNKHNVMRIIKTDVSSRSLAEIEALD